jgi:tripartite-type tricarboxylate transporter receptor subunit TctC
MKSPSSFLAIVLCLTSVVGAEFVSPAELQSQEPGFYTNKTVRIIVGYSAGGVYDRWARLVSRYMGKYISGNPEFIVQNMSGAGSLIAANYVYNIGKPDGLTLGWLGGSLYLDQLLGRKEVKFDVRKFEWIGTQAKFLPMLYVRSDSPYKSFADIIKAKEPPKCGATGTASMGYLLPKVLEETLRAKFQIVTGYPGASEIDLAVERGEINCRGMEVPPHFGREPFDTWHKKGFDRHIVQGGRKRDPRLSDTPTIFELMDDYRTPESSRRLAQTILATGEFGQPMVATPGLPGDRIQALREAYSKTLKDPELLAEAKKGRMDVDASSGEDLYDIIKEIMDSSPEIIEGVKRILGN